MLRQVLHNSSPAGSSRHLHARSNAACRHSMQQQPSSRHRKLHHKLAAAPESSRLTDRLTKLGLDMSDILKIAADAGLTLDTDGDTSEVTQAFGETLDLVKQLFDQTVEFALPTADELSVEMVLHGMQQAEAAQQQLMSEGRLADAARQGNKGISSLLETHSKLQQYFHQAMRVLLQQYGQLAVTPAGLGYAICCDLLQRPVSKQPGDSIPRDALKRLAAEAAKGAASGRQQLLLVLADQLVNYPHPDGCIFVMPSLLGMLLTGLTAPPGHKAAPYLSMLCKNGVLGDMEGSFREFLKGGSGATAGSNPMLESLQELLLAAFSKQPVLQLQQEDVRKTFRVLLYAGFGGTLTGSCMRAMLDTLPESDAAITVLAEIEAQRWVFEGHAHGKADPHIMAALQGVFPQIRTLCLTTAISHLTCTAMLEQLEGSRPLGDWGTVIEALEDMLVTAKDPSDRGWANSQAMVLKLLPQQQAIGDYAVPSTAHESLDMRDQLADKGNANLLGFMELYADLMLATHAQATPAINTQIRVKKWVNEEGLLALDHYTSLVMAGKLEIVDARRGCYPFMTYWLEVQQMALQLAGGTPGPAAKAAALQLLDKLPHSAVIARSALRIGNRLVADQAAPPSGQLPTAAFRVHPELQARALARGDWPLFGQILATGKLPDASRERMATPYTPNNSGSSGQPTAEGLLHSLTAQTGSVAAGTVLKLFTTAGSPSAAAQAYDPALCTALEQMLQRDLQLRKHTVDDVWFLVGLLQHRLLQAAGGDPQLEELLLGPGIISTEHLRPIGDFFAAKQQTTDMFAEAVCQAGWRLSSKAASELAKCCVFEVAPASGHSFRSSLWGAAALLSDPREWCDDKLDGMDAFNLISRFVSCYSQLALFDDALAAQLPAEYELLNWLHWYNYPDGITDLYPCCRIIELLMSSAGSFSAMEPAVQAVVQASAKSVVRFPGSSLDMPAVLGLVESVPLLHAADYEHVFKLPGADGALDKVWAAAVAAATDLQLAATPAFGGNRPSLPWLLKLLQDSWQVLVGPAPKHPAAAAAANAACNKSAILLLQPLVAAAKRLLQQQNSPDSTAAAQQLLCSVLGCLSSAHGLSYSGVVQPVMQKVLTVMQDAATAGLQLQVPQLPAALSAAVSAGAAAGDLAFLHAVTGEGAAAGLQLPDQGRSLLRWAAVSGSAQGMQDASCAETCRKQLLQLWGVTVSTVDPEQVPKEAAAGVAAALVHDAAADGTLCDQLLDTAALPAAVAAALLRAACQGGSAEPWAVAAKLAVVQQLLAHVQQHGMLQQLQPAVLEDALQVLLGAAASSEGAAGVPAETLPLLGALLQSGTAVSTPSAQQVLVCIRTHPNFGQQLQGLLQQQQGTAHAAAAQVLLCTLLQQSEAQAVPAQQSWQLYQLSDAQQLPQKDMLAVCSVMILQQGSAAGTDTTTPRLLQLWQQAVATAGSVAAAVDQLGSTVIQCTLPALVAAGEQQQQVLEVVELMPALLPTLAQLWQKQEQERPVPADLVMQACRLCIAAGTLEAADAAEMLLPLLQRAQGDTAASSASAQNPAGELYTGLLQLVCKHSRPAAVIELFKNAAPHLVSSLQAGAEPAAADAGSAAAAAVSVIVTAGSSQQQQQLVQVLSSSEGDTVLLAQSALSAVLTAAAAPEGGAVALLLHALQQGGKQQPAALLQPAELDRLCTLVCSSTGSSSVQDTTPFKLPTAAELAAQCTAQSHGDSLPVSAATAAMLANTLAADHPHLQPSCAAAALGVVVLPPANAANTHSSAATATAADPPPADALHVSKVLAQLCFQQLLAGLSPAISSMDEDAGAVCADLEASMAGWVPALSPAAAAAAMFAVGLHWEQLVAASAAAGAGAGMSLPQAQMQLALPVLVLELYQRAKSSGDSLVFDLGLTAAVEAAELTGDWHRGETIAATAQKAFQQAAAEGSRGGSNSSGSAQWMPVLPAARSALLSVLVHTQGVAAAGKLLTTELEEQLGVQQQGQGKGTAAAGRKGKAAAAAARLPAAAAAATAVAPAARLLSLPVVNSFLATAVKVAMGYQREGADEQAEAAAGAAVDVFTDIFKLQVAAVSLAATGAAGTVPAGGANSLRPNADTWAHALQLHGCLGSFTQVSNIVLSACRQQLPGVSSVSGLQAVLAATAAAFNAAGKHRAAVQLLDGLVAAGVTAVSHPMLAQQLLAAAEGSGKAEQELVARLLEGDGGLLDLMDMEAVQPGGTSSGDSSVAAAGAIQLLQQDAAEAMQKLRKSLQSA